VASLVPGLYLARGKGRSVSVGSGWRQNKQLEGVPRQLKDPARLSLSLGLCEEGRGNKLLEMELWMMAADGSGDDEEGR